MVLTSFHNISIPVWLLQYVDCRPQTQLLFFRYVFNNFFLFNRFDSLSSITRIHTFKFTSFRLFSLDGVRIRIRCVNIYKRFFSSSLLGFVHPNFGASVNVRLKYIDTFYKSHMYTTKRAILTKRYTGKCEAKRHITRTHPHTYSERRTTKKNIIREQFLSLVIQLNVVNCRQTWNRESERESDKIKKTPASDLNVTSS